MDNKTGRDFETNGWYVIPGFIDARERLPCNAVTRICCRALPACR